MKKNLECSHKKFSLKTIEKVIFGLKFRQKTQVCSDCGAYLRGGDFEKAYSLWLEKIYRERRDKFQVQCYFSTNLLKCLDNFLLDYPGISSTAFMRILSIIYVDHIDPNPALLKRFNELLDQEIYNSFLKEKATKKVNIQFKPKMMIELNSISELTDLKISQIIELSIQKMMTAITSQDPKLKAFWEKEIKTYLEILLKAA
jgi:hypothetical protein